MPLLFPLAANSLTPSPVPGTVLWNGVAVALVALIHIQIATFITGGATIAIVSEMIGIARNDERHERFAHGMVRAMTYVFGFGSALAILFVVFILGGLWGQFWVALSRVSFWILIFEAGTFLTEIVLLYGLYANWDRLRPYRRSRLGLLVLLNVVEWMQMFFIDVVASYMITPNGGDVNQLNQVLNPTLLPLQIHRTFGNIAWAGAAVAAFAGVQYLRETRRARRERERELHLSPTPAPAATRSVGAMSAAMFADQRVPAQVTTAHDNVRFYDFIGQMGVVYAVLFTAFQPYSGYSYAKEIQLHSYPAWWDMMFGSLSNVFLVQITLLGTIFILGTLYLRRRMRASGIRIKPGQRIAFFFLVLAVMLAAVPDKFALDYTSVVAAHMDRPWWDGGLLNPIGNFLPNKIIALVVMMATSLYLLTGYLRRNAENRLRWGEATRRSQGLVIALGVVVSVQMMVMGIIREHARHPYLISGEVTINNSDILNGPNRTVGPSTNSGKAP